MCARVYSGERARESTCVLSRTGVKPAGEHTCALPRTRQTCGTAQVCSPAPASNTRTLRVHDSETWNVVAAPMPHIVSHGIAVPSANSTVDYAGPYLPLVNTTMSSNAISVHCPANIFSMTAAVLVRSTTTAPYIGHGGRARKSTRLFSLTVMEGAAPHPACTSVRCWRTRVFYVPRRTNE